MALNQEALTTQMEDLKAGAVALPGGRPQFTQKIEQTDIDVPGGAGVLEGGIKPLGKKKEEHIQATSNEDLLAQVLGDMDMFDPVSVENTALDIAETINNPSVTDDDEIIFHAKDLGTLEDIPGITSPTEQGGFLPNQVDPSLRNLTDLNITDTSRPVEIDDFTTQGTQPFEIGSEFSPQTQRAVGLIPSVVGRTVLGGEELLPTIKDTAQNFVLQNAGLVTDAVRAKNIFENFNAQPTNLLGTLATASSALGAAKLAGTLVRKFDDPLQAIQSTYEDIKSSVVGIMDMVTNPVDTLKSLSNSMAYGAAQPIVTAVDLAHGRHAFAMDENGNLATPGFLSLLLAGAGPVSAGFRLVQSIASTPGSGPGGDPLQVLKGAYDPKTKDLAPSYKGAVLQNYHSITDAVLPGGFKWSDTVASYSSENNTYVNMGDRAPGTTTEIADMFNLDVLSKFDVPFGQWTHDQIEAATPEFNSFRYNDEERNPYVQTVNRNLIEFKDLVSQAIGTEITSARELSEVLKGQDFHGKMNTAFSDILYGPEGYDPATDNLTDFDIQKHKADLLRKQVGKVKLLHGKSKEIVPPEISEEETRNNFADAVANDYNFTYGMNRNLDSIGNRIARNATDITGNWTFGFREADETYVGDKAISNAVYDYVKANLGGDFNRLSDSALRDVIQQTLTGGIASKKVSTEDTAAEAGERERLSLERYYRGPEDDRDLSPVTSPEAVEPKVTAPDNLGNALQQAIKKGSFTSSISKPPAPKPPAPPLPKPIFPPAPIYHDEPDEAYVEAYGGGETFDQGVDTGGSADMGYWY